MTSKYSIESSKIFFSILHVVLSFRRIGGKYNSMESCLLVKKIRKKKIGNSAPGLRETSSTVLYGMGY